MFTIDYELVWLYTLTIKSKGGYAMIYTVTFNPSLDYIVSVPGFALGKTNRTVYEQMLAGGKGINVTTVLWNLGIDSVALGYVAGFTGEELIRRMNEMGLKNEFIRIENGFSRINVKIRDLDGTEINGMGPVIDQNGLDALMQRLLQLEEGDTLVLAGSRDLIREGETRHIARCIPKSELKILKGETHGSYIEHNEKIGHLIRDFVCKD